MKILMVAGSLPPLTTIDERGSKISEDLIYLCDSGSPFSEKMCQNCCKGCQILASRNFLTDAYGIGPGSAPGDLPSTCAGGQDDVSSQVNSLKLTYEKSTARSPAPDIMH